MNAAVIDDPQVVAEVSAVFHAYPIFVTFLRFLAFPRRKPAWMLGLVRKVICCAIIV